MKRIPTRKFVIYFFVLIITSLPVNDSFPFAFVFAGESNGIDVICHPIGYTGMGGALTITIGIDPASANATDMVISTQNVINVLNNLVATTGNLTTANVPLTEYDFESVLLHEMGHSMGLAHANMGYQPPLVTGNDTDYTNCADGANNAWNFDDGVDNLIGTKDDQRGDDENLCWFRTFNNDPFTMAGTVDNTTYDRDIANLPVGDDFSVNASRDVYNALYGSTDTECAMQQGTFNGEAQRTLGHDDVAGLKFAMSGVDETASTADDYTFNLTYAGLTASADIVIGFDDTKTGFAVSSSSGSFINATHIRIISNNIYFNTSAVTWFFNTVSLAVELVDFNVQAKERNALLNWITATEINHSHFEVEKSTNLQDWVNIDRVYNSFKEKDGLKYYSLNDEDFAKKSSHAYYRIKVVDLDGGYEYSDIKVLIEDSRVPKVIAISPMPVENSSVLEMQLHDTEMVNIAVYNLTGQVVENLQFEGNLGINRFPFGNDFNFQSGTYILEIHVGGHRLTEKVVK